MRLHPEIGYTALATEGGHDKHMLEVVRHHHERLNGSGYPDGLDGAELSDAVRMVTICDIYAAMTETRPYRVPLSPQDALSLMKSMGEQIDQKLVDAFTKADVCNSSAVKRRDLARCFA
jgi:HD-GYP domain-containing protein (c-di-GMP phosphodiesterase class II)